MDELDYTNLPLPGAARERLKALDAERIRRFQEKVAREPHGIEQHDFDELLVGRTRDYLSLLQEVDKSGARRKQLLTEHARRVLDDSNTRGVVRDAARKHHIDWVGRESMMFRRVWRTPDELVRGLVPEPNVITQEVQRGTRGPQKDYETALKVEQIVKRIAPDGNWRKHLDELREELDKAKIKTPTPWRTDWESQPDDPKVKKAIEHHLKLAREWHASAPAKTLS